MVWIVVAVLGLGATVAQVGIVFFTYRDYQVPGVAMNPTLKPGGSALVRAREGDEVHRGDVVMFDRGAFAHPDSAGLSVFRVVAVGGDVVACCTGGLLTVDGKPITENYLSQDQYAQDAAATTPYLVRLHEGQVFLLGDERGRARDSRFLGVVPVSAVTGFVVGTGRITHPAPLARTTAFTDAGLPGAPFEDTLYPALRWWLLGGAVLLFAGLIGLVVTLVRTAGRRRRAAAGPPGR
ncbi:signal peptidase I [Amycolatopsis vancoresmycina DSM 44592]|uniref:Signal peptidase I n=1 Tax=Amycolatopsis vancoresmycina DSM 44592 TaxID=1292037 RepID=R1I7Q7_9PSEU|nr:signal peptidase I [Amycolatopsis vancoresmycina DSM 44592]